MLGRQVKGRWSQSSRETCIFIRWCKCDVSVSEWRNLAGSKIPRHWRRGKADAKSKQWCGKDGGAPGNAVLRGKKCSKVRIAEHLPVSEGCRDLERRERSWEAENVRQSASKEEDARVPWLFPLHALFLHVLPWKVKEKTQVQMGGAGRMFCGGEVGAARVVPLVVSVQRMLRVNREQRRCCLDWSESGSKRTSIRKEAKET